MPYKIIRYYAKKDKPNEVIKTGLTLTQAQEHCSNPETSSHTAESKAAKNRTIFFGEWFDGYVRE